MGIYICLRFGNLRSMLIVL